jgi:hypothetical protein
MRFISTAFCFLFLSCCANNIVLAKEINKTHTTPKATELIIPVSIPFANKLIDINTMPFRECTFGYVYHSKTTDSLFLITGLLRHSNSVVIDLFNDEFRDIC